MTMKWAFFCNLGQELGYCESGKDIAPKRAEDVTQVQETLYLVKIGDGLEF